MTGGAPGSERRPARDGLIARLLPVLLVAIVAAAVYKNSTDCGFTWDDQWLILDNPRIADWSYARELFLEKALWRPIKRVSLMADWKLWGPHGVFNSTAKANAAGFHASNILFETLACVALYAFVRKLGAGRRLATVTAILFAVHPLHTEAITNISHRKEPLSLLFALLAFQCYLIARNGFGPGTPSRDRSGDAPGSGAVVDAPFVTGWGVLLVGGILTFVSLAVPFPGGPAYLAVAVLLAMAIFLDPLSKTRGDATHFDAPTSRAAAAPRDVATTSRARSAVFLLLTLVCFFAALLSKEVGAIMLPFLLVAYEVTLAPGTPRTRRTWSVLLLAAALPAMVVFFYKGAMGMLKFKFREEQIQWITGGKASTYYPVFLGAIKAWATYLYLLLWPRTLYLDRAFKLPGSLFDPAVLAGLALFALWIVGLVVTWRRSRLACFALAWYGLNFFPVLNLIPLTHWLVAERFAYVPSVGFALLVALGLEALWQRRASFLEPSIQPRIADVAVAVLVLVWSGLTWRQNEVWRSSRTLWEHTLKYNPESYRGLYGVGLELANDGETEPAEKYYRDAIRIMPSYPEPHYALALLELNTKRYKEAIEDAEVHARLAEDDPEPFIIIGNARFGLGDYAGAAEGYREAVKRRPEHVDARYNLANALYGAHQYADALGEIEQVLTLRQSLDFYMLRGNIQEALQTYDEALLSYGEAARINPTSAEPLTQAGLLFLRLGRIDEARAALLRSLQINPDQERVKAALARIPPK